MADNKDNVVYLRGYVTGTAKCLSCNHKWVAVVPAQPTWFKCPNCGAEKGHMIYPVIRCEYPHWQCSCGNDLFYVTTNGIYCPNCGAWQTGWEEG